MKVNIKIGFIALFFCVGNIKTSTDFISSVKLYPQQTPLEKYVKSSFKEYQKLQKELNEKIAVARAVLGLDLTQDLTDINIMIAKVQKLRELSSQKLNSTQLEVKHQQLNNAEKLLLEIAKKNEEAKEEEIKKIRQRYEKTIPAKTYSDESITPDGLTPSRTDRPLTVDTIIAELDEELSDRTSIDPNDI